MCFRPSEAGGIEHRCPECGTNNLPEATMCANCFAPMEPLDLAALAQGAMAAAATPAAPVSPAAPAPPHAPAAPQAPSAPVPPSVPGTGAVTFGGADSKADEPDVGEVFSF